MIPELVGADVFEGASNVVTFSDGTQAMYFVEELLKLRPNRKIDSELVRAILTQSKRPH